MKHLNNLKKDKKDKRDWLFAPHPRLGVLPPESPDILQPVIVDQGPIGSCVGNGVCRVMVADLMRQGLSSDWLSRLFNYFGLRDDKRNDTGGTIRDGIKAAARDGVCLETTWPYHVEFFDITPTPEAYTEAKLCKAVKYESIVGDIISGIQQSLLDGYSVVFGTYLYKEFETVPTDGLVPMPSWYQRNIGRHCMVIIKYITDAAGVLWFKVANSWSDQWGAAGYCWMRAEYIIKYASDPWVVQLVEGERITNVPIV